MNLGQKYYSKKITTLTLLLLLNAATVPLTLADSKVQNDSPSLNECRTQAKLYLDEIKPTQISDHCFGDYLAAAYPSAIKKTDDGQTLTFGYQNILFIQVTSVPSSIKDTHPKIDKHIISGKHSHLREITALALDNLNQDVIVLDGKRGLILPFSLKIFGNVSPRRTLKNKTLIGATSIAVDPVHGEILVASNTKQNIQFFSRLADVDGHKPNSNTAQLRSIEGSLTQIASAQGLAIDPEHDEIFLLDKDSNQILVFDRAISGNSAPKRVVRGNLTQLLGPVAITYNKSNDTVEVVNGDGNPLSYPRIAIGDMGPLALPTQQ